MPVPGEGPLSPLHGALFPWHQHTQEIFVLKIFLMPKLSFPPASPRHSKDGDTSS